MTNSHDESDHEREGEDFSDSDADPDFLADGAKSYKCKKCSRKFTKLSHLKRHMDRKTNCAQDRRQPSDFEDEDSDSYLQRKRTRANFKWDSGYDSNGRGALRQGDELENSDEEDWAIRCLLCEKMFKTPEELSTHALEAHNDDEAPKNSTEVPSAEESESEEPPQADIKGSKKESFPDDIAAMIDFEVPLAKYSPEPIKIPKQLLRAKMEAVREQMSRIGKHTMKENAAKMGKVPKPKPRQRSRFSLKEPKRERIPKESDESKKQSSAFKSIYLTSFKKVMSERRKRSEKAKKLENIERQINAINAAMGKVGNQNANIDGTKPLNVFVSCDYDNIHTEQNITVFPTETANINNENIENNNIIQRETIKAPPKLLNGASLCNMNGQNNAKNKLLIPAPNRTNNKMHVPVHKVKTINTNHKKILPSAGATGTSNLVNSNINNIIEKIRGENLVNSNGKIDLSLLMAKLQSQSKLLNSNVGSVKVVLKKKNVLSKGQTGSANGNNLNKTYLTVQVISNKNTNRPQTISNLNESNCRMQPTSISNLNGNNNKIQPLSSTVVRNGTAGVASQPSSTSNLILPSRQNVLLTTNDSNYKIQSLSSSAARNVTAGMVPQSSTSNLVLPSRQSVLLTTNNSNCNIQPVPNIMVRNGIAGVASQPSSTSNLVLPSRQNVLLTTNNGNSKIQPTPSNTIRNGTSSLMSQHSASNLVSSPKQNVLLTTMRNKISTITNVLNPQNTNLPDTIVKLQNGKYIIQPFLSNPKTVCPPSTVVRTGPAGTEPQSSPKPNLVLPSKESVILTPRPNTGGTVQTLTNVVMKPEFIQGFSRTARQTRVEEPKNEESDVIEVIEIRDDEDETPELQKVNKIDVMQLLGRPYRCVRCAQIFGSILDMERHKKMCKLNPPSKNLKLPTDVKQRITAGKGFLQNVNNVNQVRTKTVSVIQAKPAILNTSFKSVSSNKPNERTETIIQSMPIIMKKASVEDAVQSTQQKVLPTQKTSDFQMQTDETDQSVTVTGLQRFEQHICGYCEKPFTNIIHLEMHLALCRTYLYLNKGEGSDLYAKLVENIQETKKSALEMEENKICFCCGDSYEVAHTGYIRCPNCPKSFRTFDSLNRHLIFIHATIKKYPCNICNATCPSELFLHLHKKSHKRGKPCCCNICGMEFVNVNQQCKHILSAKIYAHRRRNEFPCENCGKTFNETHLLRLHSLVCRQKLECDCCENTQQKEESKIHNETPSYTCVMCSKKFTKQWILKGHLLSHAGEALHAVDIRGELPQTSLEVQYIDGAPLNEVGGKLLNGRTLPESKPPECSSRLESSYNSSDGEMKNAKTSQLRQMRIFEHSSNSNSNTTAQSRNVEMESADMLFTDNSSDIVIVDDDTGVEEIKDPNCHENRANNFQTLNVDKVKNHSLQSEICDSSPKSVNTENEMKENEIEVIEVEDDYDDIITEMIEEEAKNDTMDEENSERTDINSFFQEASEVPVPDNIVEIFEDGFYDENKVEETSIIPEDTQSMKIKTKLCGEVAKLMKAVLGESKLSATGWPKISIEEALSKVIKQYGYAPVALNSANSLFQNARLFLSIFMGADTVNRLLKGSTLEDLIRLKIKMTNLKIKLSLKKPAESATLSGTFRTIVN